MRRVPSVLWALVFAVPVHAQVELGVDAGLQFASVAGASDVATFELPIGAVRLGIGIAPRLQLQVLGVAEQASVDNASKTRITFRPGVVGSLRPDTEGGPFIYLQWSADRRSGEIQNIEASDMQFGFGAGLGTRIFVTEAAAIRLTLDYMHWAQADLALGGDKVTIFAGFSVFP